MRVSACSTGYYGILTGARWVFVTVRKDRTSASLMQEAEINDVNVLIEPKGNGGTIEFTETGYGECLTASSNSTLSSDKPVYAPGQICAFEFDGMLQDFTVDEIGM